MAVIHRPKSRPEVFASTTSHSNGGCLGELNYPRLGTLRFQVLDSLKIPVVSSTIFLMIFDSDSMQHTIFLRHWL